MENRKSGKSEGECQAAKQEENNQGLLLMLFFSCERSKKNTNHSRVRISLQESKVLSADFELGGAGGGCGRGWRADTGQNAFETKEGGGGGEVRAGRRGGPRLFLPMPGVDPIPAKSVDRRRLIHKRSLRERRREGARH